MYLGTPSRRFGRNESIGATANATGYAPRGYSARNAGQSRFFARPGFRTPGFQRNFNAASPRRYSQTYYPAMPARPDFGFRTPAFASFSGGRPQMPRSYISQDTHNQWGWNYMSVDPIPSNSLVIRLNAAEPIYTSRKMNTVENLTKSFPHTFSGQAGDDWYNHINKLELEVFQQYGFHPHQ